MKKFIVGAGIGSIFLALPLIVSVFQGTFAEPEFNFKDESPAPFEANVIVVPEIFIVSGEDGKGSTMRAVPEAQKPQKEPTCHAPRPLIQGSGWVKECDY